MATRMQQRRGTAQQWTDANPILAAGEIGFESGTNKFKIGDGVNTWSALTYYASASEIAALVDGAPDLLNTLSELSAAIGDDANFGTTIENSINTSVDEANTFTTTAVSNHRQLTQAVHGIADTSLLATTANVATAKTEAITAAQSAAEATASADATSKADAAQAAAIAAAAAETDTKIGTHNSDTANVHGIADTSVLATATTVATAKSEAIAAAETDAENKVATGKTEAIAAAATASESYSDASITTHNNETTNVHGIADTAALALTSTVATDIATAVTAHSDGTTNVHGIADTALLATKVYADGKASDAQTAAISAAATAAGSALSSHESDTTNVHGIADTSLLATTADVAAVTKTTLGLGNVDNTSDADKPVSTATVTAIATAKSEAIAEVTAVIDGAPGALDTLNELAAALGDDANFAGTVTTSLAAKVDSYTPITQKTESYTLSTLDHRDDLIEMGSASALTLTIPLNSSIAYPVGTSLDILQTDTGQVTIAGDSGVTVNATPGLKLRTQWSSATLFKRAENTWVVYGDLTA